MTRLHVHIFDALERLLHPLPRMSPLSPRDQQFLKQFREIVDQHQADAGFTTAAAAACLGLSRMHLNRKLHALTRQSTHEYILRMRLEGARALLSQPLPMAFIAQAVGFKSRSHFSNAFRKRFGVTPSVFRFKHSLARQPTKKNSSQ